MERVQSVLKEVRGKLGSEILRDPATFSSTVSRLSQTEHTRLLTELEGPLAQTFPFESLPPWWVDKKTSQELQQELLKQGLLLTCLYRAKGHLREARKAARSLSSLLEALRPRFSAAGLNGEGSRRGSGTHAQIHTGGGPEGPGESVSVSTFRAVCGQALLVEADVLVKSGTPQMAVSLLRRGLQSPPISLKPEVHQALSVFLARLLLTTGQGHGAGPVISGRRLGSLGDIGAGGAGGPSPHLGSTGGGKRPSLAGQASMALRRSWTSTIGRLLSGRTPGDPEFRPSHPQEEAALICRLLVSQIYWEAALCQPHQRIQDLDIRPEEERKKVKGKGGKENEERVNGHQTKAKEEAGEAEEENTETTLKRLVMKGLEEEAKAYRERERFDGLMGLLISVLDTLTLSLLPFCFTRPPAITSADTGRTREEDALQFSPFSAPSSASPVGPPVSSSSSSPSPSPTGNGVVPLRHSSSLGEADMDALGRTGRGGERERDGATGEKGAADILGHIPHGMASKYFPPLACVENLMLLSIASPGLALRLGFCRYIAGNHRLAVLALGEALRLMKGEGFLTGASIVRRLTTLQQQSEEGRQSASECTEGAGTEKEKERIKGREAETTQLLEFVERLHPCTPSLCVARISLNSLCDPAAAETALLDCLPFAMSPETHPLARLFPPSPESSASSGLQRKMFETAVHAKVCQALGVVCLKRSQLHTGSLHESRRREVARALEWLWKAQNLDPLSASSAALLALCLALSKRLPEALRFIRRALELQPARASSWVLAGLILSAMKRYPQAVALLSAGEAALEGGTEWAVGGGGAGGMGMGDSGGRGGGRGSGKRAASPPLPPPPQDCSVSLRVLRGLCLARSCINWQGWRTAASVCNSQEGPGGERKRWREMMREVVDESEDPALAVERRREQEREREREAESREERGGGDMMRGVMGASPWEFPFFSSSSSVVAGGSSADTDRDRERQREREREGQRGTAGAERERSMQGKGGGGVQMKTSQAGQSGGVEELDVWGAEALQLLSSVVRGFAEERERQRGGKDKEEPGGEGGGESSGPPPNLWPGVGWHAGAYAEDSTPFPWLDTPLDDITPAGNVCLGFSSELSASSSSSASHQPTAAQGTAERERERAATGVQGTGGGKAPQSSVSVPVRRRVCASQADEQAARCIYAAVRAGLGRPLSRDQEIDMSRMEVSTGWGEGGQTEGNQTGGATSSDCQGAGRALLRSVIAGAE
eukprot:Cvel_28211.t1-p1 / transcript=Cvel_28211.t1 / gene=Cvel_28211 / organism=Chromera_velia_CCMP2878 / gene_product=hypothetical protein / transcript_product=hypothetical protein / location=Cvel_scaffold3650:831-8469(-) / protein_length=1236 / sequence_SO=supercontig / SO=protein_coding / is_pseudo=false